MQKTWVRGYVLKPVNSDFYPAIGIWRRSFFHMFCLHCHRLQGSNYRQFFSLVSPLAGGIFWWLPGLAHCTISGIGGNLWVASRPQVITQTLKPLLFSSIFFDPWNLLVLGDFSGPGLSGPGFFLAFFPIIVISRYTAGKHTRRMGILLTQTV